MRLSRIVRDAGPAVVILLGILAAPPAGRAAGSVIIGNYLVTAPDGIAFIVDDGAAFVVDTGGPYVAGAAAADGSYNRQQFTLNGARIMFEWGRVGSAAVARLSSNQPVQLPLRLSAGWPGWTSHFTGASDGAAGQAEVAGKTGAAQMVKWRLLTSPPPVRSSGAEVVVSIAPGMPVRFVAGVGPLPDISQVDRVLREAAKRYTARRPVASGDWGDFVGAIADNVNNSRIYSSDNHRLAHSVSRAWAGGNPNNDPYFCWDSFFTANLACLDDPQTAENTVRAILSYETPQGLVPNFAHWQAGASDDRSQPPVGALCVWKMYQRWPDKRFLAEVYPKLVKWHNWWPGARDGNHNGLLEWGSATGVWQNAQYETGWDDNLHFSGTRMVGSHMDADAVDLSSLWSMDAEYLADLAAALGRKADAKAFQAEHRKMNQRINDLLWNDKLGLYCSRLWKSATFVPVSPAAFGAGFDAVFYSDENLHNPVVRRHDGAIDFDWNQASPAPGVAAVHWSARWTGALTPPESGTYRFTTMADDGVRLYVDGKRILDDWVVHPATERTAEVKLVAGRPAPVVVEYFQHEGGASLTLSVAVVQVGKTSAPFLTRITPMNFYPLIAGVPDAARAKRVMAALTDPKKFWGTWVLPTLAYDDPDYHQQEYWRGDIWGPVNYLVFQGLLRFATAAEQSSFADKSVRLFMRNWTRSGVCGENYLSTDGTQNHDPHYTWGALLDLVGIESICDAEEGGMVRLNGVQTRTITIRNLPIHGRRYEVRTRPGIAQILRDGKVLLTARNRVVIARLR
ncbi:MAG TPA: PA14 domain-containing protein [Armatimonadota bacterium]|nr:PA14 domain-containing protein [Armatimonadota bacterium]